MGYRRKKGQVDVGDDPDKDQFPFRHTRPDDPDDDWEELEGGGGGGFDWKKIFKAFSEAAEGSGGGSAPKYSPGCTPPVQPEIWRECQRRKQAERALSFAAKAQQGKSRASA